MFTDTHAHLHFAEVFKDLDAVLERAVEAGLQSIINVGVDPADSRAALKLARTQASAVRLFATAGLHPHAAAQGDPALDLIHDMAEDVIAIGECGLDYYRHSMPKATKSEQDHALRSQIEIALEHNLPMIWHVRDAWEDFFAILQDYPQVRGVIHSFTGHQAEVERAQAHPAPIYFGLNGIMTFTKDQAQLQAARLIPAERVLLETDCPYLAPVPHRGQRNEPAYIPAIAEFLSHLRGVPLTELAAQSTANAEKLFRLSDQDL